MLLVTVGWTLWSDWGTCSSTCGAGIQHRTRSCQNPQASSLTNSCEGESSEYQNCVDVQCSSMYTHTYTFYTDFNHYMYVLNVKIIIIILKLEYYLLKYDMFRFDLNAFLKSVFKLMVAVGWTVWSAWNDCSSTCGTGVQHRTRSCQNIQASYLNNSCAGESIEYQTCVHVQCSST